MDLIDLKEGSGTETVSGPRTVLVGDTTGNGFVNSSDVVQTKSQSGHPVTVSNYREDVTANGTIDSADIALVKSFAGTGIPTP